MKVNFYLVKNGMEKDMMKMVIIYEIINGKGKIKQYDFDNGKFIFEGEYLNGERLSKNF